jgi:hypothetical protein
MYSGILYEKEIKASCGDDVKDKAFSGIHLIATVRWRPRIDR